MVSTIEAVIRRHSALIYFGLVSVIGRRHSGTRRAWRFSAQAEQFASFGRLLYTTILAGPCVAGVLLTGIVDGWKGLRDLLARLRRWAGRSDLVRRAATYAMGEYVQVYDPPAKRWTQKAKPPVLAFNAAATVMLSRIYIVGGYYDTPLRTTLSYDPATDTWTRRADLPSARYGIAASKVFVNGLPRLEVVGGPRPGNNLQYIP